MRTKEIWTSNIDEAINFPYDRHMNQYNDFLRNWCEVFGEDLETEQQKFKDNIDDRLTLGIIDGCYNMAVIENFWYIEALKRLAMSGQIIRKKNGWRIKA
jgi:hypothetical protein